MRLLTPLFIMLLMTSTGCTDEGQGQNLEDGRNQSVPAESSAELQAKQNYFEIETPLGNMVIRLFDETPLHRDNFAKLVDEGFYNNTTFHRVIANFMIQGGDPNSKDDDPYNDGLGGPGYTVPAEFRPELLHTKGALSAARMPDQVNPDKESSGSQFYIVQGSPTPPEQLAQMEYTLKQRFRTDFAYSEEARIKYATEGGTPFLDMNYTVFGELVDGLDVLDKISTVETERSRGLPQSQLWDRPFSDITMTIRKLTDYPSE